MLKVGWEKATLSETFPIKNTSQHWLHGTGGCRSRRSQNASNLLACASPGVDNVHSRSILAGKKVTKLSIITGNWRSTHSGFWTFTFNMLEACERLRNCFRSFDVVTLGCHNSPKYSNDNQRRALHTYNQPAAFSEGTRSKAAWRWRSIWQFRVLVTFAPRRNFYLCPLHWLLINTWTHLNFKPLTKDLFRPQTEISLSFSRPAALWGTRVHKFVY